MKKTGLIEILNSGNIKRILALVLVIFMVTMTGCFNSEEKDPSTSSSNASSQNASENNSSNDVSSEESSSDTSSTEDGNSYNSNYGGNQATQQNGSNTNKDKFVLGEIAIDNQETKNSIPTDANEIEPLVDPTNLMTNYKGYADKERNKLRDEILNTPNTLELYDVKGKVYYVSTSGNDANDGLSPEKPIQTLAAVDGLLLEDGDAVLFERGCIWRMTEVFECRSYITYGSYGEGRKPMILGSPKNFAQEIWKPSKKKNVWQINYMYNYPCGAFFDNGKEAGYLKTSMRAMTANTHFFFDESMATLYLYCDKGNPSDVWDDIEFSQAKMKLHLNGGVHDVVVDNIAIRYTGQGGVGGSYKNGQFTVTNCEIGFTGGAWVGGDPSSGVRYCNGLEAWCAVPNIKWDHNWIYHTFDTAVSPQGNQGTNYHNMSMDKNLLEFNNADFEFFEALPGKYKNYTMNNNICRFTSLGWGTREDDGGIRGIDGVQRGTVYVDQIESMYFNNNIIDCPGRMIYKMTIGSKKAYDNWERKGNVYYIKQSIRTTTALTFQFHWKDATTRVSGHSATNAKETIKAFAEFEPDAKVYWYK